MKRITRPMLLSALFSLCILYAASAFAGSSEPRVEAFSPQGPVKKVRQVSARFSTQMVTFGDLRLGDPFDVGCPEKGKGRWADGRNWVYDFDRDLPAGVECGFMLKPGLKDLDGNELTGQKAFVFSTGGPAIISSNPYEGSTVDEDQAFVLTLDAEPAGESVSDFVYFSVDGINERVGLNVITGKLRDEAIKLGRSYGDDETEGAVKLVVQPRQNFPSGKAVHLVWGKGVSATSGVATVEDQTLHFKTRTPFEAKFYCSRENPEAGCIPILPMDVTFSAPVSREFAGKVVIRGGGKVYRPTLATDDDGSGELDSEAQDDTVQSLSFAGPFPENTAFTVEMPEGVWDDAGRPLANMGKFPLAVRTDKYPPLAKFAGRFGIIERADPVLPVTVRNIEAEIKSRTLSAGNRKGTAESVVDAADEKVRGVKSENGVVNWMADAAAGVLSKINGKITHVDNDREIIEWLRKVVTTNREHSIFGKSDRPDDLKVPRPGGTKPFEVIGIPLKKTGLYMVELESPALGAVLLESKAPMYVPTAALVTNMAAHFKWGRESSLVWVTSLDKAAPVKGASVKVTDCYGKPLWEGRTDLNGVARIDKQLPSWQKLPHWDLSPAEWAMDTPQEQALQGIGRGMFVFVRTKDDMTFVHSSWSEGIETWRFGIPEGLWGGEPLNASTVFDRSLLRAGETVHMKHFIRKQTMAGFSLLGEAALPKYARIRHLGDEQEYELPLNWDRAKGTAESDWPIPRDAKLGHYEVSLEKNPKGTQVTYPYYENENSWRSGMFRVEEFRVPQMKAAIQPPSAPLINAAEADVDLSVSYLSGGGANGLPVKLRSRPEAGYVDFREYDGFVFGNGAVKEGIVKSGEAVEEQEARFDTKELTLGPGGAARAAISGIPKSERVQDIHAEMEFRDPSGEIQTVSRNIRVWPSGVVVGIKPDSWAASKDVVKFTVATLDTSGKPVPGTAFKVDIFTVKHYSHRKRVIGGFYSYESATETKKARQVYEGRTDAAGKAVCEVTPAETGEVVLQASSSDPQGNATTSNYTVWVAGKDDWWFDVSDNDRIDVLPEKKEYNPGDTAKLQVRMPFREATALVTVEREGVMDVYVRKLSGKGPVIDIPVKSNYSPNAFISVLCVRGRAGGVKPTAMVDLGRPAYKLGIAEINVGWQAHRLDVKVMTEKDVYRVRDKASARIKVTKADGRPLPAGGEVAVAVVDEGLLELMPNESWKLLDAMMRRRGDEVDTSTAQMQVVGKRHYGLKALPAGGGGGNRPTREMFDTLILWKGRVPLDKNGEAKVDVPLKDALSSFRITAVASAAEGLFGEGHASIRTTQDLILASGLPQMVRQSDRFTAGFTVRNASGRPMDIEVSATADSGNGPGKLVPVDLALAAGEARDIGWEYIVPADAAGVKWEVAAREKDGTAADSMRVSQKAIPVSPVRVVQATLMQLDASAKMDVARPDDAEKGRGGIRVTFKPKISGDLSGIEDYMRRYPYSCMEQKVSKAIALRDEAMWRSVTGELPAYLDGDGLVKYFPLCPQGSEVLTTYILSIADEAGWALPPDAKAKMEDGLAGFVDGRVFRNSGLPTADLSIRKMAALEALSRDGKAAPNMLGSITVEPNLWPTSAVIDWFNVLKRVNAIPERDRKLKEAEQVIRARLNFQGTTMGFSTERSDYMWWLMVSTDVNAVRSVLTFMGEDGWREDMPRLMRGAVGRQYFGRWCTTNANAWGRLALEKFSNKFEAVKVAGDSSASLNGASDTLAWAKDPDGGSLMFGWPARTSTLGIAHSGAGKPWVTVQSLAAIPLKEPLSSGYKIKRTVSPVVRKRDGRWSVGDVVRVRLELESQSDMTWVVVNDPIPAGASILGTGLGRDSRLLTSGEKYFGNWVWPVFEERSYEAFRAYYEFVPKGGWSVEYTVRLNNEGAFRLPETRVEALYSPEMFGERPNGVFEVGPQ